MVAKDTFIGIAGAAVLVAAMVGVFIYESASAPAALDPSSSAEDATVSLLEAVDIPFEMRECSLVEAFVEVPPETVRPHVPDAFRLASLNPAAPATGTVTVAVGGLACEEGGTGDTTGPIGKAWFHAFVLPDDATLRDDGIDRYYYRMDHYVLEDPYGAVLADLGDENRPVESIRPEVAPTGNHLFVEGESLRHHAVAIAGPPLPSQAVGGELRLRQFGGNAADGFTFIDGLLKMGPVFGQAPGSFEAQAGTLAAEIMGASGEAEILYLDGFSFEDLTVGFVPVTEGGSA